MFLHVPILPATVTSRLPRRGSDEPQSTDNGDSEQGQDVQSGEAEPEEDEPALRLLARYTPPGWDDPPPCCPGNVHDWRPWRAHPNGVNDVRSCRRSYVDEGGRTRECWYSDWRQHTHWPAEDGRACRLPGCPQVQ